MSKFRQIILIMTDTQRWDMLGCYAQTGLQTPNLDRLASEGMRFERAYNCQPVCGPARSAMFTGLFPHSNGSWANSIALSSNVKTIGQRMLEAGFTTCFIGKWHLDGSDYFGLGRAPDGWDAAYWYDMRNYLEELNETDRRKSRRVETMNLGSLSADFTFGHRCSNRAIDFLTEHASEDFFLVLSCDEPHHPYLCPEPFSKMYRDFRFPKSRNVWDRLESKPDHQKVWAGTRLTEDKDRLEINMPFYFGCNSFIDSEIGRVLEAIDRLTPECMVIYTSDHGDMLESHSLTNKGPFMYDEVTRIPFIIRWPGKVSHGITNSHLVSHIDIVPTILDAAGLPQPNWLEGISLLPTLEDPSKCIHDVVFMEFGRYEIDHDPFAGFQPIRSIFDGRWKLVINLLTSDELYDLENDPEEMINLIEFRGSQPERDRLHNRLIEWMNTTRDPFRGYYWERRPWRSDAQPASWAHTGMTRQRENDADEPRQLDYATGVQMDRAVRPIH